MSLSRLLRVMGLMLATIALAVVFRGTMVNWQAWHQASLARENIAMLRHGLMAMERISRERVPTNALLGDQQSPSDPAHVRALALARSETDAKLRELTTLTDAKPPTPYTQRIRQGMEQTIKALDIARAEADAVMKQTQRSGQSIREVGNALAAVVPLIAPVNDALSDAVREAEPAMGDEILLLILTAELREHAGLLGSHLTAALTYQRPFTLRERQIIDETRGRVELLHFLLSLRMYDSDISPSVVQSWQSVQQRYFDDAQQGIIAPILAAGNTTGNYGMTLPDFAARYAPELAQIVMLRNALIAQIDKRSTAEQSQALTHLLAAFGVSALLLSALAYGLATLHRRILRPLAQTTQALRALAHNDLSAPLPQPVAQDEIAAIIGAVVALREYTRTRQALEQERNSMIAQLREKSNTDFLTSLPNRRAFFNAAKQSIAQAQRQGYSFVIILLDVDHFKQLNDHWGHAVGDQALVSLAQALRSTLRQNDSIARLGGEEFVVLSPSCEIAEGRQLAERLRETVARTSIPRPDGAEPLHLTVSLGVADSARHGCDLEQLLSLADAAMYRAKEAGRNCVRTTDDIL